MSADAEFLWQMLGAYEAADQDFDRWCQLLDLAPTDEVDAAYLTIHDAYAQLWLAMGDSFHARLNLYTAQWRARRKGRVEVAKLAIRALLNTGGAHA